MKSQPTYQKKVKLLQSEGLATGVCCWSGRRIAEKAAFGSQFFANMVRNPSDLLLSRILLHYDASQAAMFLQSGQELESKLVDYLQYKYAYLDSLPFSVLGVFAHTWGKITLEDAKATAKFEKK